MGHKIGIGLYSDGPVAAAELVELGHAEPVGPVDHDRIDVLGISRPDSMIFVQTRTSNLRSRKSTITSRAHGVHLSVRAVRTLTPGRSSRTCAAKSSMSCTRSCTT